MAQSKKEIYEMRNLLLISSSRVHGSGFLEHCLPAVEEHFESVSNVLFIPYALADHDSYARTVSEAFKPTGIQIDSIHDADDPVQAVNQANAIFIGGGNSFRLLKTLYDLELIKPIRDAVLKNGVRYMGSSAGTNMACPTIRTSNDMPIVEPPSFDALGFIPFQINPHFLDADPNSTHKGETREQRLAEYLEENSVPVAGLREGSWLRVNGDQCLLQGETGMKLFRQDAEPAEIRAGDISYLLSLDNDLANDPSSN
ncbi:MAG: dipeptidase PepE [Mariniblastus sp.]